MMLKDHPEERYHWWSKSCRLEKSGSAMVCRIIGDFFYNFCVFTIVKFMKNTGLPEYPSQDQRLKPFKSLVDEAGFSWYNQKMLGHSGEPFRKLTHKDKHLIVSALAVCFFVTVVV